MAHRIFTDSNGTSWLVLAVYPSSEERRLQGERRTLHNPDYEGQRRKVVRRQIVRRTMEKGWLVFKAERSRRRLTPITENWDSCPASELETLLERAIPARRSSDPPRGRQF